MEIRRPRTGTGIALSRLQDDARDEFAAVSTRETAMAAVAAGIQGPDSMHLKDLQRVAREWRWERQGVTVDALSNGH